MYYIEVNRPLGFAIQGVYGRKDSAKREFDKISAPASLIDEKGCVVSKKGGHFVEWEWFIVGGRHPLTHERVPWAVPIQLQYVFDELHYFTTRKVYEDTLEWVMVMGRYTDALEDLRTGTMPKDHEKLQKIILGKYDNYVLRLAWDP